MSDSHRDTRHSLAKHICSYSPKLLYWVTGLDNEPVVILDNGLASQRSFTFRNYLRDKSINVGFRWVVEENEQEDLAFESADEVVKHYQTVALIS